MKTKNIPTGEKAAALISLTPKKLKSLILEKSIRSIVPIFVEGMIRLIEEDPDRFFAGTENLPRGWKIYIRGTMKASAEPPVRRRDGK